MADIQIKKTAEEPGAASLAVTVPVEAVVPEGMTSVTVAITTLAVSQAETTRIFATGDFQPAQMQPAATSARESSPPKCQCSNISISEAA